MKLSMTFLMHDLIKCTQFKFISFNNERAERAAAKEKQCDKFHHAMCKTLIYRPSTKEQAKKVC